MIASLVTLAPALAVVAGVVWLVAQVAGIFASAASALAF